jgi:hypothetical protein
MPIKERKASVENPRALKPDSRLSIAVEEIGPNNASVYAYHKLKSNMSPGEALTMKFGGLPEAVRSTQFGRLLDLVKADTWMREVIKDVSYEPMRLLFDNDIAVYFQ